MQSSTESWFEEPQAGAITVQALEDLIKDYKSCRDIHEAAKKVATEKYADLSVAEGKVVAALTQLGKKSYKVEGVGLFTRVTKEVVTTPKDIESKIALYEWIKNKYGDTVLESMRSINHQTLNSFYNQEVEKEQDNPAFTMPGISAPTSIETVSFRKA